MSKRKILLAVVLVWSCTVVYAQPGPGDPGHGRPVPISGIEILLALGGILGVRKHLKATSKK